jgi:hypothetical protein
MSGEVVAIDASLLAVYDHTQRKKEAFVTSNRVEFELTPGLSANLALPDYGRFARHPFPIRSAENSSGIESFKFDAVDSRNSVGFLQIIAPIGKGGCPSYTRRITPLNRLQA